MSNAANRLFNGITNLPDEWILDADNREKVRKAAAEMMPRKEERHFVGYEIKKLLGARYLWVFLAILLLVNSAVAWVTAGNTPAAAEPADMIAEFFETYFESPDEIDAHYAEMQAFAEEQNLLFSEAVRAGNYDFEPETMPNLYSDDDAYPDILLFDKLYSTLQSAKAYPALMDTVIDRAQKNLSSLTDMGVSENSFAYRYQLRVTDLYRKVRENVTVLPEYSRGWQEYFSYDTVNIFIFVMLVMLGSLIFAEEKQSGILPILRTAKHGRIRTATAKILTMLLLSTVFTLLFSLSTFAVFGLRIGYSSPENVLQSLPGFVYSPYRITIGAYFFVSLGMKILTFALFSSLLLLLSVIFYNYVLIFLSGFAVFGLNFLLYTLHYTDANNISRNLNLLASSAVTPLFERFRALNFFGNVIGFVPAMLVLFPLCILVCSAVTTVFFAKESGGIRIPFPDTLYSVCMSALARARSLLPKSKRRRARVYTGSLVLSECFKTLISSRFLIVILLILTVKVWYSVRINTPERSYSDAVYKEYMTALEGEVTEEKLAYLQTERKTINETLGKKNSMQKAYLSNEISFDEYHDYLSEYNYAYSRDTLLSVIERHAEYLKQKESECGVRGWFLYDTGWKKLYRSDADLFLYASILLLFVGSFAAEYVSRSSQGSFVFLLRSTKNGRRKTFFAKLVSSGVITLILSLLTLSVDIAVIFRGYDMPSWNAPLCSIEAFEAVRTSVTVGQYLFLFVLLRIAAALLMTLFVCALSELLAKYLPVLGCAAAMTLLPALCAYFGFSAAQKLNFLNLLAATPLFLQSAQSDLFGNGYSMLILWLFIAAAAVWAMMVPAKRMFIR